MFFPVLEMACNGMWATDELIERCELKRIADWKSSLWHFVKSQQLSETYDCARYCGATKQNTKSRALLYAKIRYARRRADFEAYFFFAPVAGAHERASRGAVEPSRFRNALMINALTLTLRTRTPLIVIKEKPIRGPDREREKRRSR